MFSSVIVNTRRYFSAKSSQEEYTFQQFDSYEPTQTMSEFSQQRKTKRMEFENMVRNQSAKPTFVSQQLKWCNIFNTRETTDKLQTSGFCQESIGCYNKKNVFNRKTVIYYQFSALRCVSKPTFISIEMKTPSSAF